MKRLLASFSWILLFSACALCQISSSMSSSAMGMHGTMTFGPPFPRVSPIAGAPFSAEELNEDVQTLADGTHIRHFNPGMKLYRDSMGRTRTEHQPFRGPMERRRGNLPEGPTIVEISDPVAHVSYVFDLDKPVAHRRELPAVQPIAHTALAPTIGAHAAATAAGKVSSGIASTVERRPEGSAARPGGSDEELFPQTTTEDLGTEVIEGIPAEGKRQIATWPVNSMGNDRPITDTSETWTSPDLKEVILRKDNDPRNGERTHKLININRGEPDPSLFEPPPGYTVKNEKQEFTLSWGASR